MIAKQFLLSTQQPIHPSFNDDLSTPPRIMTSTLSTEYMHDVAHLVKEGGNDRATHKTGLITLHTTAVQSYISSAPHNKVLNAPPPEIHAEEKSLPRRTRSVLSQLRSGYSSFLNAYMHRINKIPSPDCPKCGHPSHDTHHLFECPQNPTSLQVIDLWMKPKETATFLELDNGDAREEDPG